ncbi:MAG: phytanoyl-CoA dioxygenase family protein [Candidatus Poribacteria bacterium]|nr:phytanoyl-CoA dioxygenase family protein [Candidatus Poribacteria bacterium]
METMNDLSNAAVLAPDDKQFVENNGYLLINNALPPDVVAEIDAAVDEVYDKEKEAGNLEGGGKLNLRNCITHHEAFLQLLDWHKTFPLACGVLNWNIQMITSHLIVLPSKEEPPDDVKTKIGLHRDGGTSYREMQEPHPRILLKIAYAISDQSDPASGATVLVPGSNRLTGMPARDPETGWARGAISMNVNAGDAFLFEQRTYHGIGHNWSGMPRKTIFMGYAYRWVKPMDYIMMPDELVDKCNPIQKQLIGIVDDPLSYYIPKDQDVPLKSALNGSK